ncbi:hypothetical protein SKAU_G00419820 [Synaphobranchus kaupii]|uniref:Uncharacterized protein n=1 Tax=Synaphobranchus kaupii TaxID=118154 RepID=A0A9Q1E6F8_SYNKA|nr:hypothetical protein SKAU_G00419820 [Synaphobranchus kaupii]
MRSRASVSYQHLHRTPDGMSAESHHEAPSEADWQIISTMETQVSNGPAGSCLSNGPVMGINPTDDSKTNLIVN